MYTIISHIDGLIPAALIEISCHIQSFVVALYLMHQVCMGGLVALVAIAYHIFAL